METYQEVARVIREKKNVVAFTGAGISVDAGIPAFRGGQGLWEKYDPMEYAEIGAFVRYPEKVWIMLRDMGSLILTAEPSPAHKAIGALEKAGFLNAVITQNVDGLHQLAGNTNVIEYHGNHRRMVCPGCSATEPFTEDSLKALPYPVCGKCGGPYKPDVVFFGEPIPARAMRQANDEAMRCGVMVIVGTSGVVYPAAEIPFMAARNGAIIVEINVAPTPFTSAISNHFIEGSSSAVLPTIIRELGLSGE